MLKTLMAMTALAALPLLSAPPAAPQPGDEFDALRKEVEALEAEQAAVREDLEEIKALMQEAPPAVPPRTSPRPRARSQATDVLVAVDGAPFEGSRDARLTLVDFTDYQCPFCARHVRETLPQIYREYIQTGKLKYVVRNFPIQSRHKLAVKAAQAAECAGEQGKFWAMHARLFADQRSLDSKGLVSSAQALGLELPVFEQCLEGAKYTAKIRKDVADGQKARVRATPTFFLGVTELGGSEVRAVRVINGAAPYPTFKEEIDALMASLASEK